MAACTDELLRHGLPGLTLATLATAAGTSSRMLLYHFTTRDQLVSEALREARRRQQKAFGGLLAPRPGVPYGAVLAAPPCFAGCSKTSTPPPTTGAPPAHCERSPIRSHPTP